MAKWRVLISAPYFQLVVDEYRSVFEENDIELVIPPVLERLSEEDLLKWIDGVDGAICGDDQFSKRVLERAPKLKVISKWGTGIDSIDTNAAARLGIKVCNTRDAFTAPVADTVFAFILAFARNIPWADRDLKQGIWSKRQGVALKECALGVVGVGNVGQAVLRRGAAFGMKLLGNDILPIDPEFVDSVGLEICGLDDLLAKTDFVSINCDLNPSSHHLIGAEEFRKMKPTARLINTARGPVVDEKALVAALQSGEISGAGLDVFEDEPLPEDSPLKQMDSVLLSPHNANSSPEAWERVHRSTLDNLLAALKAAG